MRIIDRRLIDSTGAFLVSQLEQLDRTIHEPLMEFTWSRDIDVRSDATMGHDFTSYTNSQIASVGGINPTKKAFISKDSSTLPNVAVDIGKTASPLMPWGLEVQFTVFELEASMLTVGGSIDEEKHEALKLKHQQDTDIMVYLGDSDIPNAYGLLNSPQVQSVAVAADGSASSTLWPSKTPDQITQDVNELLTSIWTASGFKYCPTKIGLSPLAFGYIATQKVSDAGNISIMTYIEQNSLSLKINGRAIEFVPIKWCAGTNNANPFGVNATDLMIAYTQLYKLVRFPMVPMVGLPVQFKGAAQIRPYVCKLGLVEFVYPETLGIRTGIY